MIHKWIRELGDDEFAVRERAQEQLARVGFHACDALTEASNSQDLEVASRARYLLRIMKVQWTTEGDPLEVKEILKDYESEPADQRLVGIRRLAALHGGQGAAGLCRIVRFEKSELLSKYAALAILEYDPQDSPGRERLARLLRKQLGLCRRTPAQWLLAYADLWDKPAEGLAALARLVDAEQQSLGPSKSETGGPIVISLIYQLAMAQAELGDPASADQTARRARRLQAGDSLAGLLVHLGAADGLRRRGRFDWAEAEFRLVMAASVPEVAMYGRSGLAEMLHDRGEDLRAAQVLEEISQAAGRRSRIFPGGDPDHRSLAARMNYYYACHWAAEGDLQKHRQYLDAAIRLDPTEIDVLIARHRLAGAEPEYRRQTDELIAQAAKDLREKIRAMPEEAESYYNQLAWLLGNTGGDFNEALQAAQQAVAAKPDSGAYYDTLAHVYAGRGDYANAVRYQTRAAELEPHSGLILGELAAFRKRLEETKNIGKPAEKGK
jgi:tetratricopeptide (TPR) repeat protein